MIPNAQEHEADQDCEADKTDPPPPIPETDC